MFAAIYGVALDLRGFTITSTAGTAAGEGITIEGSNIALFNGHIVSGTIYDTGAVNDQFTGTGFTHGVYASSFTYHNIRVRDVSVQGCDLNGIYCQDTETTLVESCVVQTAGGLAFSPVPCEAA